MDTTQQTIELFKTVLETQHNSYNTLFYVLIAITTLLTGSSWLWNLFIAKKQIKSEVGDIKNELTKFFKDNEKNLIDNIQKELSDKIDFKYSESYGDIARIIAINAFESKSYKYALIWWFTCLQHSLNTKRDGLIRIAIDEITKTLNIPTLTNYDKETFDMKLAIECINRVSEILSSEKINILRKLSKLKVQK